MKEKVSVIVPIYNTASYLKRCLESLLSQTYENIEVLMIDDCSTDGSVDIAKEYSEKYPDVFRLLCQKKNSGSSAARNAGINQAQGTWLSFVDSDDWVTEDYISAMYEVAQSDDADIVMCSVYYYYSEEKYKEVCPFDNLTTESSHKEKIAFSRSYPCSRLFRKSLFVENGIFFPEDIWRGEDIGTIIPILTKTDKISLLSRPMYFYFQHPSSKSSSNSSLVDVTFYPKTINRMLMLSALGFNEELEFRAVLELLYGMIMIMVKAGYQTIKIKRQIEEVLKQYPKWRNNKYYKEIAIEKRIFMLCASRKKIYLLKILILFRELLQKVKGEGV